MVHPRTRHGLVVGDQEDELVPVDAAQHQAVPVDGHGRQLVEPEDLVEEPGERVAVLALEQVGGHAHGHVVEAGVARRVQGMGHRGVASP